MDADCGDVRARVHQERIMVYTSPGPYNCKTHVGYYRKNEVETIDVEICYDDVMAADEYIDFHQWSYTEGLGLVKTWVIGTTAYATIMGGEAGKVYAVACTADTSKFQRIKRAAFISIVGWPT